MEDGIDGKDGHIHEGTLGWKYYKTLYKVGDYYFEGIINIQLIPKGLNFKDITQIKDVTEDIMNSYGKNPKFQCLRTSSMSSVTENRKKSIMERKHSFAGVEAATADKSMLELANEMEQRGEDSELNDTPFLAYHSSTIICMHLGISSIYSRY